MIAVEVKRLFYLYSVIIIVSFFQLSIPRYRNDLNGRLYVPQHMETMLAKCLERKTFLFRFEVSVPLGEPKQLASGTVISVENVMYLVEALCYKP
jgi:hypothetical protein